MYNDLFITKIIERDIITKLRHDIDLKKLDSLEEGGSGYVLDAKGNITGLSLFRLGLSTIGLLSQLASLTHLVLSRTKLRDISSLSVLQGLEYLDLLGNQIQDIRPLEKLTNLSTLILSRNRIEQVAPLSTLNKLEVLDLSRNQITDISPLDKLTTLQKLLLDLNNIEDISSLQHLVNLNNLNLSKNNIKHIWPLANLNGLHKLDIHDNKISELTSLQNLKNLRRLQLQSNPIKTLPSWITELLPGQIVWSPPKWEADWMEDNLYFYENPIEFPTRETVKEGKAAIRNWFRAIAKGEVDNGFIRLILAGNTTAGKTSLVQFMTTRQYNRKQENTHGIRISYWTPENTMLKVNIWDFGGQDYYHGTHRLFLEDEAVYLLLWNSGTNTSAFLETNIHIYDKQNHAKNERVTLQHFHYMYWLHVIRQFGKTSPVILVQTKSDIEKFEQPAANCFNKVDEETSQPEARTFYISIEKAWEYSINQKYQYKDYWNEYELFISALIQVLKRTIKPAKFPANWDIIRTNLIERGKSKHYIPYNDYVALCEEVDPSIGEVRENDLSELDTLTSFLTKTGIIVYYSNNIHLQDYVFLSPRYLTETIYKVLNLDVKKNNGHFILDHVIQVLGDRMNAEIFVELMKAPRFELVFNEPGKTESYIAPQYLPYTLPDVGVEYKMLTNPLRFNAFTIRWPDFMLPDIMIRFLSRYGEFALYKIYWRYGILFDQNDVKIFVKANPDKNLLSVYIDPANINHNIIPSIFSALIDLAGENTTLELSLDGKLFVPFKIWSQNTLRGKWNFVYEDKEYSTNYFSFLSGIKFSNRIVTNQELSWQMKNVELLSEKEKQLAKDFVLAKDADTHDSLRNDIEDLHENIKELSETFSTYAEVRMDAAINSSLLREVYEKLSTTHDEVIRLKQMISFQSDILHQLGIQSVLFIRLIHTFNEQQTEMVNQLLMSIEQQQIETEESSNRLATDIINRILEKLPNLAIENKEEISVKINEEITTTGKLKLTIPLVPGILSYEKDFSKNLKIKFKSWKDLWAYLFK
ncbi:MAG TPA: COR domain-containing protein [Chitinophagaceae bacterium]|nr:COR domain-containing protein [Chitinophagaceae bacterium]